MASWKLLKPPLTRNPLSHDTTDLDEPRSESSAAGVAAPEPAHELLGLHAALEEMAHLRTLASTPPVAVEALATPQAPLVLPGEVTEDGEDRLIRITGEIQALIESGLPTGAAQPVEAPFSCAWLPADCRGAFEILNPRCPPRWAEALRKLRVRLLEERARWESEGRRLNSLAVVSPRRSGGRSATARNLAACLGTLPDARVLLLDADAGRPSLHRRLRLELSPGLTDAIATKGGDWRQHIRRVPDSGLHVLPLGRSGSGIDAIDPIRLTAFLERASADFGWVIVDAPPMETADGEAISAVTDGTVLVLRNQREYFDEADAAVRRMDRARLLGAILNFA